MAGQVNITKREIISQFVGERAKDDVNNGVLFVLSKLELDNTCIQSDSMGKLRSSISALRTRNNDKWKDSSRSRERYESKNKDWLDGTFQVPQLDIEKPSSSPSTSSDDKAGQVSITRREIISKFVGERAKDEVDNGVLFVLSKLELDITYIQSDSMGKLRSSISALRTRNNDKWKDSRRSRERYESKNKDWLDGTFHVPQLLIEKPPSSSSDASTP